ncbi:MAG TPA: L-threonine 3-dehydrogenase [Legionellales bacterium]|nr:L-threonine 3-dehydrogenase [Legionellales bacterium]
MKALVKLLPEKGIWLQDVEKPIVGKNDVLIEVEKTAICGTDMHIYHWDEWAQLTIPVPMTIGHEFYGRIVALGDEVKNYKIGQRVSGEGHLVCGVCKFCRTGQAHLCPKTVGVGVNRMGAFAKYLSIPQENVIILPDDIPDEYAAILDPLGNATHTALSFDLLGEDVLITGAGPIGLMAVAIAKIAGARRVVITDINAYRLELAKKMGADATVLLPKQQLTDVMKDLGIEHGFGVGLEMSGHPSALTQIINALQHGGGMALLGIPPKQTAIDWHQVIFKCLRIQGIYGRKMYSTWYKMMAMLQSGLDLSPIITHEYAVADYQEAFEMMSSGHSGKILLDWRGV